jgi:hypothetical protein
VSWVAIAKAYILYAAAIWLLASVTVRPSAAQQLPSPAGIRVRPDSEYAVAGRDNVAMAKREELVPSRLDLGARTVAGATGFALLGGALGFAVDVAVCKRHKDRQPPSDYGRCLYPAQEGTAIGWFGGALLGATKMAATGARERGCPARAAWWRAAAGATAGALPGVLSAASRPEHLAPSRSVVLLSAPLLAGAGAAAAVASCHR